MAQYKPTAPAAAPPLVARASTEYRVKRYIIVTMLIAMGLWFGYDGYVAWPRENARIKEIATEIEAARKANDESKTKALDAERTKLKEHSNLDLTFQRVLFFALPPIGLLVLAWSLYNSRGTYRLADQILTVPGHPPIPLDMIRSIDKTDWDRKGIAYVNYELPNGAAGAARLDDFIYERRPTDDIFKRIEDYTGTGEAPASSEPAGA